MVLFGLNKYFGAETRSFDDDNEWNSLDEKFLPRCQEEAVPFHLEHHGNRYEIKTDVEVYKPQSTNIEFNFYTIFVDGDAIVDGRIEKYKREFPMPKGAIKKQIRATVTPDGKISIIIPLEKKFHVKSLFD
ncbi:HR29 [Acrasis kona]|uniref:HR29 n=1 Tax=Acrasis kona TaxID=1008807 RepID=A0AAW2Z6A0_9EUKA